ncbi:MAG TPA: tRNA-binding protein [Allosphingosinicella sp.]
MHKLSDAAAPAAEPIDFDQFLAVDIRCGTVIDVQPFPEARKPAWKLRIDFGPGIGIKRSSAQITEHYRPEDLVGTKVAAVVNFPPRQIGPFMSEVLTVGLPDAEGRVVLVRPDRDVPDGARLF